LTLAAGGDSVEQNIAFGSANGMLQGALPGTLPGKLTGPGISPNGNLLLCGREDGTVTIDGPVHQQCAG
jgi:hypothetical protein